MNTPTPEEIVAMSDIIDKHYPNSDYVSYSDIRAMMFEYAASLNRQGCRWVKASEPPFVNVDVIAGHNEDQWVCGAYFDGKKWWNQYESEDSGDCQIFPTHWMLLPNAPNSPSESIEPCATSSESFEQILREEFLVNTQNYPKEYHQLFHDKFNRAEKMYNEQQRLEGYIQEKDNAIGKLKSLIEKAFLRAYGLGYEAAAIGENPYPTECWRTFKSNNKL